MLYARYEYTAVVLSARTSTRIPGTAILGIDNMQSSVRVTHLEIHSEDSDARHDHDTGAEIRDEAHGRKCKVVVTPLFLGAPFVRFRSVACSASHQLRAP